MDVINAINWNIAVGNKQYSVNRDLEQSMIDEEVMEIENAIKRDDKVEIVDGCIDVLFVVAGTIWKSWEDMENIIALYGFENVRDEFDLLCISDWMYELKHYSHNAHLHIMDDWCDVYNCAIQIMYLLWLSREDINRAWDEVCRSNDSKLPFEKDENGKVKKSGSYTKPDLSFLFH